VEARPGAVLAALPFLPLGSIYALLGLCGSMLDLRTRCHGLAAGISSFSVAMLMALVLVTFGVIRPRELEGDKRRVSEGVVRA
jgi:hypothetical protein